VVRSVQNHGIRDLPTRFKARYPDAQGNRYFRKGRFISIYYDSNPFAMQMAENALSLDSEILRFTNLKARSPLDYVNTTREDRNPFIRRIVRMEAEAEQVKQPQQQNGGADKSA
jgi:ribosomal protein S6